MPKRKPTTRKPSDLATWAVSRIRARGEHVATVRAKSAEAAIEDVAEQMAIPEHERFRLTARQV